MQETARRLVLNLLEQIGETSIRSVADKAGIDHSVLRMVLAGRTWPDLIAIAKLERWFGVALWPGIVGTTRD